MTSDNDMFLPQIVFIAIIIRFFSIIIIIIVVVDNHWMLCPKYIHRLCCHAEVESTIRVWCLDDYNFSAQR